MTDNTEALPPLDALFRENFIPMNDRNGALYDAISAALAQRQQVPENATEPMQKAMQRAVLMRKSMNDVWRAALAELPEPVAADAAEVARLRQALRDIADPISAWKRDLQEGYTLDGAMCVHMANNPETYKRMAREALRA